VTITNTYASVITYLIDTMERRVLISLTGLLNRDLEKSSVGNKRREESKYGRVLFH